MKVTHRQNGRSDYHEIRLQPCDRAADWEPLLYDYAEGLTDEETGAAVGRHLRECAYCRGALADIQWMTSALKASVPEPKTDLSARVMETIHAEKDISGRIVAEQIDARTGRILSSPTEKRGLHRLMRAVGCIAAALVLVFGLMYILPLLRMGSGASSGTQDILLEMQSGENNAFSDGVFVGTAQPAEMPIVLLVSCASESGVAELLSQLIMTTDGYSITVTITDDGFLLKPLSALAQVTAMLTAEGMQVTTVCAADIPASSASDDAFYIQVLEPQ